MTVTIHPRETGCTLRCNYAGCTQALTTGQIQVKLIRAYAKAVGWIRGLDKGSGSGETGGRSPNRRWDICPVHAVEEQAALVERKRVAAEARAARHAALKLSLPERIAKQKLARNAAAKARRARKKAAAEKHAAQVSA